MKKHVNYKISHLLQPWSVLLPLDTVKYFQQILCKFSAGQKWQKKILIHITTILHIGMLPFILSQKLALEKLLMTF